MARIEELITFRLVVERMSFSRAAEALKISQPAVSQQMKALEADLGVRLLDRKGQEVLPTEAGRWVYETACQMVDLYTALQRRLEQDDDALKGKLQIGASSGPGETLVPLMLAEFKHMCPQVDLSLRVGDSREIIDAILNHQLEIGFVGAYRRDRLLAFDTYLQDELILVVPPQHPWAKRTSIAFEEFLQAPLILQQQGSGATTLLREALAENGLSLEQLNVMMELGLQESTRSAVRAGYGVTIISRLGARGDLARGELVHVPVDDLDLRRSIYICHLRDMALSTVAQNFLEFARRDRARFQI